MFCLYEQEWSLELEEVFALEREGESDQFATYRDKLKNKMLLWHGKFQIHFTKKINSLLHISAYSFILYCGLELS